MQLKFLLLTFFLSANYLLIGQSLVSGKISEVNGDPLGFVTVVEKGTNNGTVADLDGNFEITLQKDDGAILVFSFVGYQTTEVPVNGQKIINLVLPVESELLEEVVVVGYGTQKKSDITGSVAIIKVEDAKAVPTTNVAEMLRGKSAGVQVTLNDPSPGGNSKILIRGKNSMLGGNDPLFIIDGVPTDNINGINSEDVKSIEVLKDASAQAIYGARASNGVILVTTKRGEKGKFRASYHGYYGQQKLTKNFDLYSAEEWAQLRREAFRSVNGKEEYEAEDFVFTPLQLEVLQSGQFVDWEAETINQAVQQNHSLSLSGGNENATIFASFGYFDQKGIISGSAYQRGTARINLDYKVSERFKFGANVYLLSDKTNFRSSSLKFITLPPLAKIRDERGDLIRFPTGDPNTTNPLWNIRESTSELFANEYNFTFFAEYEIFKHFKYKLNSYAKRRNKNGGSYFTRLHSSAFATNGKATISAQRQEEYLIENLFTFDHEFNKNNNIDITFLQSVNQREFSYTQTTATDFPNDLLGYNGIASAAEILPVVRTANRKRLLSFMGRIRYSLNNKYLLTLTGRRDGSSVFAPNKKWGFFPSAALAWKTHLEPFIQKLEFINELKIRASYGSIGNEAISPYQTLGLASTENYLFDGVTYGGYLPGSSLFNPDLKWETSTTFNLGIDFGLLDNFFVGNFEIYNTQTTDLLVDRTTPGGTGYSSIISNIGKVENSGIELGLTTNLIRRENLNWNITTNFSKNDNKIISLFGEVDADGNLLDDISRNRFIGKPIDVIFQYQYDGIWSDEEEIAGSHMPDARPGDIRVKDINGDGKITTDDRVIISAIPDWFGSLSSRISFKGLELFADLYIVEGATKTNTWLAGFNEGGTLQGVLNGIKVDYWTPEDHDATHPRPRNNETPSFIWAAAVSDASYVRLRTVSLAYHLPVSWLQRAKFSAVTIYGTATNLITWTDFKSYSPETTVGAYPDGKSFILGIKVSL